MATRGKRPLARKARPAAARKNSGRRTRRAASRARARSASPKRPGSRSRQDGGAAKSGSRPVRRRATAESRVRLRPIVRMATGWSTLQVVWRPAIAMATLPYRVYRVYRWAEAESHRSRRAQSLPIA